LASTQPVVNNGGLHSPLFASGQTASLNAGLFYPMIVLFGENGGGDVIDVKFARPGGGFTDNGTGLYFNVTAGASGSIRIDGNVILQGNSALISKDAVVVTGNISRDTSGANGVNLIVTASTLNTGSTALNSGSINLGETGQLGLTLDSESKINGAIVAASLTKAGVGRLGLFGNNANLGAITFQSGTLQVASTSNLAGGSAPLTLGNANSVTTLQLTGQQDVEISKPITLAGNSRIEASGQA
jgi:hypothetical protein